jgi:4-hydroxy-tetrahydrodipicolinate reductase
MRVLVLGRGKTGKLVADVAAERGHSVDVLDAKENKDAAGLTAPYVAGFDIVIDFTAPEAVVQNMRACLANGAKMVIGTTGWYDKLADMEALAARRGASLLHGRNFSVGVQVMLQLAADMAASLKDSGYAFTIEETHHTTKLDSPSGTALTLAEVVEEAAGVPIVPIESKRVGDAAGTHQLIATGDGDKISLQHDSFSRRGFAEGAVRAAEWLSKQKSGCYDFRDVFAKL